MLDPSSRNEADGADRGAWETARHEGVMYYFCCAGSRQRFESDPARYVTEVRKR
jgi:YHS domain-containing protein